MSTTTLALPAHHGRHRAMHYRPRHRGRVRPVRASYPHPRHRRPVAAPGRHKAPQTARPVRPTRIRPTTRAWGVSVCVVSTEQAWTAYCCVTRRAGFEARSTIRVIEVSKRAHCDVDYAYVSGYRDTVPHTTTHRVRSAA